MTVVVVTTGAVSHAKLQSNHHQQTNIQFFTGRMPFLSPNQQCQSTEGKNITFHGLAYPKLTCGVFQLCLWPLTAPGYLGGGLPCLSSALWCQYPASTPYTPHFPDASQALTIILTLVNSISELEVLKDRKPPPRQLSEPAKFLQPSLSCTGFVLFKKWPVLIRLHWHRPRVGPYTIRKK